jgi:hypothetical protein
MSDSKGKGCFGSGRKFKTLGAIASILVLALCCTTFGYYLGAGYIVVWSHKDPHVQANLYVHIAEAEWVNGIYEGCHTYDYAHENLGTTLGEQYFRDVLLLGNVSDYNITSVIAVGNATVAASLTKLTTEATTNGFGRDNATIVAWMNGTHHAVNYTLTLTCVGLGEGEYMLVNATALCYSLVVSAEDAVFMSYLTDGTNHQFTNTSNMTLTWVITFDSTS